MKKEQIRGAVIGTLSVLLMMATSRNPAFSQTTGKTDVKFKKHTLTTDFISEGVAVGDVNGDNKIDIIAGAYWFEAPSWKRHEITPGKTYNPHKEYSKSFLNYCMDVNLDGWVDLIWVDFPGTSATWYENPKNKGGHWKQHLIYETVGNESPNFVDIDGDGRIDFLFGDSKENQMVWLRAPKVPGGTSWEKFTISEKGAPGTARFSHGLGYADINKDGRPDVIVREGWWEAPPDPMQPNWTFHPANLGEACSHIQVADVNGDGYNDVITTSAHKIGIWWHEQKKDAAGNTSWQEHLISNAVSQTHATNFDDLNGDGFPDLITGQRWLSHHNYKTDSTIYDPSLLLWFEHTPGKAPYWIQHEIDNDSGAGINFVVQDITNDGKKDIIIANKKGVFFFKNITKKKRARK